MVNYCNNSGPDTSLKFLAEYFKDEGYSTYHVGKWHLGQCSWSHAASRRGFDRSYGSYGGGMSYYNWQALSPDYCGAEERKIKAIDYWNSTKLETGEYLDKRINVTDKIENNIYLTDDQATVNHG